MDDDLAYRAVQSRDARFDGWFFVAVTSTGIYCRPSCASVVPARARVRFFTTAAGAQRAGFRACKRCRPDAAPGSPEWNRRGDLVGRAMREISDGTVDREGVAGLAGRLGYSARQLNRLLLAEVGAGPLELARARRAETARILLETTELRAAEVAFGSGFGSVRQFNDTIRAVFAETPLALRERAERSRGRASSDQAALRAAPAGGSSGPAPIELRLAFRPPLAAASLFGFLATRAVPGVEAGDEGSYRRAIGLPHGPGVVAVTAPEPGERTIAASLTLSDLRDLSTAVKRLRQLLDLDADPAAVAEVLGEDPLLSPALSARPGMRVPGHVDPDELAIRAVLGQQVSVAGARRAAERLSRELGEPLDGQLRDEEHGIVRLFPSSEVLAGLSPQDLPMPKSRARALIGLATALRSGDVRLGPGSDRQEVAARLLALPGIGPWTVAYIQMRALGDPDAYLPTDLGVRRSLERAGRPGDERSAVAAAERWRPYRAYAVQCLWSDEISASRDDQAVEALSRTTRPLPVPNEKECVA